MELINRNEKGNCFYDLKYSVPFLYNGLLCIKTDISDRPKNTIDLTNNKLITLRSDDKCYPIEINKIEYTFL